MKTTLGMIFSAIGGLLLCGTFLAADRSPEPQSIQAQRDHLYQTMDQGNYKDAYDGLRKIVLAQGQPVDSDLDRAVRCLEQLNRVDEIDELLQSAVQAQQDDARRWWFLWDAARNYMQIPKQGVIVAGKFHRGNHRGGDGRWVNAAARDRVRALQLMARRYPTPARTTIIARFPIFSWAWPTCC